MITPIGRWSHRFKLIQAIQPIQLNQPSTTHDWCVGIARFAVSFFFFLNRSNGFGGGGGGWPGPVDGAVPGAGGVAGVLSALDLFFFLNGFIFLNTSAGDGGGGGGPCGGCADALLAQTERPIPAEIMIKHFLTLIIGCITIDDFILQINQGAQK